MLSVRFRDFETVEQSNKLLNVAQSFLAERYPNPNVAEFSAVRGRSVAIAANEIEFNASGRSNRANVDDGLGSTMLLRGQNYVTYFSPDKAGDVYADYGLVVMLFSRVIRGAEEDIHGEVVSRERLLPVLAKVFVE